MITSPFDLDNFVTADQADGIAAMGRWRLRGNASYDCAVAAMISSGVTVTEPPETSRVFSV